MNLNSSKPKMLLHVCCAPCSTVPIDRLQQDFEVTLFFYNPNIHPPDEYVKRRQEIVKFSERSGVPLQIGDYETDRWYERVRPFADTPEGGKRCELCYAIRLEATAQRATEMKIGWFCTSLTLSPHKRADIINRLGSQIGHEFGVKFHEDNFKKRDGFKESCRISTEEGLYRQNYCGCEYSKGEGR
jgi:predicted adenine nucleotide alpha hydrolase (AANH) superfamily ATPase